MVGATVALDTFDAVVDLSAGACTAAAEPDAEAAADTEAVLEAGAGADDAVPPPPPPGATTEAGRALDTLAGLTAVCTALVVAVADALAADEADDEADDKAVVLARTASVLVVAALVVST